MGDTVGDPFKDTSGPSLNILIKLCSTVSINVLGLILLQPDEPPVSFQLAPPAFAGGAFRASFPPDEKSLPTIACSRKRHIIESRTSCADCTCRAPPQFAQEEPMEKNITIRSSG